MKLLFATMVLCLTSFALHADEPANIVLIIADDLGYGETGMMGNQEIPTPHIDALAARGVRCTAGYVTSSYCSPSRAGIMTGRYQSRFGYDRNPVGKQNLDDSAGLPNDQTTFVRLLADAGYKTGLVGKWHLGSTQSKRPTSRGFGSFYGFLHEGHYYVPGPPFEKVWTMVRDKTLKPGERVRKDMIVRGNYAPISEPDYNADNPVYRETETLEQFDYLTDAITDEALSFIEEHHDKPFCLTVAYNAVHSPMQAKASDVQTVDHISDIQRRIFAGMLVALDRGVGRVSDAIETLSLTRKTLVVFVSDNGGPTQELTSSNAPLRGGKGSLYEGGIRVPMLWSMPGRIAEGKTEDRPVLSLDIAATALDLAGIEPVEGADGQSIFSWINDATKPSPHQTIFWRMPRDKLALRHQDWKIVRLSAGDSVQLYHLGTDLSETKDLASQEPAMLSKLIDRWESINAQMAPETD
ncbi:sulfatase-like hydrolase/transferase [Rubripirellula amarantea]|nr:sulfatase-like hydrolase/transferase [Rubripirellula amarantea]